MNRSVAAALRLWSSSPMFSARRMIGFSGIPPSTRRMASAITGAATSWRNSSVSRTSSS